LFALVLLVPKALGLRRRRKVWNALRFLVAVSGAFLVGMSKSAPSGSLVPWLGLLLILIAVFVRPEKKEKPMDVRARELGALVVVNGGQFRGAENKPVPAQLFVAPERVHVLDSQQQILLEIPLGAVSSLRVEPAANGWKLLVAWNQSLAEFYYDGVFAEHLARVAEATLRSQLRRELPVIK